MPKIMATKERIILFIFSDLKVVTRI